MTPTLRSGRATRSTPAKSAAASVPTVNLLSPVSEPAQSLRPPAPTPGHQPPVKRQRTPRKQQAAEVLDDVGPSSQASKGKMAASAAPPPAAEAETATASAGAAKASQQPPWKKQRGVKRVMAEFHAMSKQPGTQISHLEMVDDNALKWSALCSSYQSHLLTI